MYPFDLSFESILLNGVLISINVNLILSVMSDSAIKWAINATGPIIDTRIGDEESQIASSFLNSKYKQKKMLVFEKFDQIHRDIQNLIKKENIRENSAYYSKLPHEPGSKRNRELGLNMAKIWEEYGLDKVDLFEYDVLLSKPENPAEILLHEGDEVAKKLVVINEPSYSEEPSVAESVVFPYGAYSRAGNVTGGDVYCNYSRNVDYKLLLNENIVLKDKIFLLRWGVKSKRKILIRRAIRYGALALIIFSDPNDFTYPGEEFPKGWMLNQFGMKRGTIGTKASYLGDLLSKGYPSKHGYFRENVNNVEKYLFKVPMQTISAFLASELIEFMNDETVTVPDHFKGSLNVTYHLQSKENRKVTLNVQNRLEDSKSLVVCGFLYRSLELDRYVLIGNHRDAWTFGASDPVSGSAVITEIARVLGKYKETENYRPRRSVMLCSWGAEEAGMQGSVEWCQEKKEFISTKVVSYLNMDMAVEGNYSIRLKSSPLLAKSLFDAAKKVYSPNNKTLTLFEDMCHKHAILKNVSEDLKEPEYSKSTLEQTDSIIFAGKFGLGVSDYRYTYSSQDYPN